MPKDKKEGIQYVEKEENLKASARSIENVFNLIKLGIYPKRRHDQCKSVPEP